MPKFIRKPEIVEAHQWFKNGDHPEDGSRIVRSSTQFEPLLSEGKVVRRFRRPDISGKSICPACICAIYKHGWIDTPEGGHTVCPGDWIITDVQGEKYPCKPDIFRETYDPVETEECVPSGEDDGPLTGKDVAELVSKDWEDHGECAGS